ncbi:MAG: putative aldo-keto reductase [Acidimicrobiales bacterium]|nr:putative aldo-keto reductase [Acidimicrobiales bacterium]
MTPATRVIERAPFGRTGHDSSRVIFGAAALWAMPQAKADQVLDLASSAGVNHIDTAADYGESEVRLAPWLSKHRGEVFLATKTGDRGGADARRSLERSLERLGVDHVDLIQLHNLVEDDEFDVAHGPGGAVEALAKARDEGLVRFIGVTGHGLRIAGMHSRSLERFDFDSVLLPYNYTLLHNETYRPDVEALLETCTARQVAVQTIKSVARRRWTGADADVAHFSWYEPLTDGPAIGRAVRYVLARPQLFLNTSSDARVLSLILEAAAAAGGAGAPPTDAEMEADIAAHAIEPLFDGAALERI